MSNFSLQSTKEARAVALTIAKWVLLNVAAGFVLRIALLLHPITVASTLTLPQWLGLFALGIVNDACIGVLTAVPLLLFLMSSGHRRFGSPWRYICMAVLVAAWVYVTFGCRTLWEFNKPVARIVSWLMVWWTVSFVLRVFLPGIRRWWMRVWTAVLLFVYLGLFIMNVVGEWFFWNEFGVRYNFIAVDYLVYTNEVIGNIMQSYSMGWIITGAVLATIAVETLLYRHTICMSSQLYHGGWRMGAAIVMACSVAVALPVLYLSESAQHSGNAWYDNLQANGVHSFVKAFFSNELEYDEFYITADTGTSPVCLDADVMYADTLRRGTLKPNIVLVTIESMSGDYLRHFGNDKGLTPYIDSLWPRSVAFERMFAAGNRTVRGLEALTLSRPPSPGESIIKRADNTGYPSVADKLREMGYGMTFYYGGDSYFDNMLSFFTGLGYDIHDRTTMADSDITCQTVWGVCDGDIYRRVLADLDSVTETGHPVLAHILTTSNHRPYIYPEDCVTVPGVKRRSREGAVAYSDYALGQFIEAASSRPWFGNTVFVVVADHCASSAGSTQLPLNNYHIPALIYAPALLEATTVDVVTSQIDLMPTLFALLGWREGISSIYGRDALADTYMPRAFVATYQDLGYLRGDTLTVLSPGRNYRQFVVSPTADDPYATIPVDDVSWNHINEAACLYQSAATCH